MNKKRLWQLFSFCMLTGMLLVACNTPLPSGAATLPPEGIQDIDPIMYEYYMRLGGQETLGYGISTIFSRNGKYFQYTEGALLIFNPSSNTTDRYTIEPIGLKLDIFELPRLPLIDEQLTVDGYPLYYEFVELYEFLGFRFTGKALTNPIVRTDLNRVEQYFENFGFVIEQTPGAKPRLLSYGVYDCEYDCRYTPTGDTILSLDLQIPEPFASFVDRVGINLVGIKVSEPYLGSDGHFEMVFSNMVLYYNMSENRVFARPIAQILGFTRNPVPMIDDPNYVFYLSQGILGYNVPTIGQEYITQHGGLDMLGLPISDPFELGNLTWQCFTNICLTYDTLQPLGFQVKPAALGDLYFAVIYDESIQTPVPPNLISGSNVFSAASGLTLRTTEKAPYITPEEQQSLLLEVFQNAEPLAGAEVLITISAQGIDTFSITSQPTAENGSIIVQLPHIPVPNDTLVFYKVCLDQVCVEGNFLIWELK